MQPLIFTLAIVIPLVTIWLIARRRKAVLYVDGLLIYALGRAPSRAHFRVRVVVNDPHGVRLPGWNKWMLISKAVEHEGETFILSARVSGRGLVSMVPEIDAG